MHAYVHLYSYTRRACCACACHSAARWSSLIHTYIHTYACLKTHACIHTFVFIHTGRAARVPVIWRQDGPQHSFLRRLYLLIRGLPYYSEIQGLYVHVYTHVYTYIHMHIYVVFVISFSRISILMHGRHFALF